LRTFFWPQHLAAPYPHAIFWPLWLVIVSILIIVVVSFIAIKWRTEQPWLLIGWLWFLGMLVPVIGLLQVGAQPFADRYTYVPLIGIAFAVIWVIPTLLAKWQARKFVLPTISIIVVAACIAASAKQVQYWRNTKMLFEHTLAVTKNNAFAQNNLAVYYLKNGD